MTRQKKQRQERALKRLESQLKSGQKFEKINKKETSKKVKLSEKDIFRIEKEINILKERI